MPMDRLRGLPALRAYLEELYGGQFAEQSLDVNVNNALTALIGHDFERLSLTFINTGSNDVRVTPDQSASATNGILLGASGGILSLNARDDLVLVGYEWYAFATPAASSVHIIYTYRYT